MKIDGEINMKKDFQYKNYIFLPYYTVNVTSTSYHRKEVHFYKNDMNL